MCPAAYVARLTFMRRRYQEYCEEIKTPEGRAWKEERYGEIDRRNWRKRRERKQGAEGRYADDANLGPQQCAYCGVTEGPWEADHVYPLSRIAEMPEGFTSSLVLACKECNRSKHDRLPAEFVRDRLARGLPVNLHPAVLAHM
jgi:5-methylcytosine-specific restriction endonuclease McrA